MKGYLTTSMVLMVACSGDKSLTVQNPAPTADIISHDEGSEILEGFAVTLEGVVSDSNHTPDQLTTRWVINGEVVCDDIIPDEDGSTFCEVVFDTDETEISLEVRDAEQKFGSDTINVVIVETEAPIVEIITPMSDGVYYSDQLITFEGLVSDAEDDPELLVAYWESTVDGVLSDVDGEVSTSGEVLGYGTLSEGQHAIELHVEDTMQKSSTESVVITVGPPNSAPLCEISSPEDGAAGPEGELVTFAGTVSDVDVPASYLSIEWSSDKDGVLGSSSPDSSGNVSFPFADLTVNTHVISMTVTDEVGAECVANRTYTVGTAPSIIIDAPTDGDVINEGTPITFSATISDSQDQPDAIALDWVVDGNSISTQGATSSGEATFSDSTLTYGAYNLVVTATDTDGLTDSDQINFTVNGLPSAPVISINPDPATTSDGLSVSIDSPSVDPEGTIPTYTYEWQLGGQAQTAYTTSTLPSSATNKGEQWTVVVTPNDGITDGASTSASITIANTAPTLSGLSITPTGTTYNDDVLTCAATVTDPDESPIPTYEWTVGGSVIGSSSTLDLSQTGVMPDDVVTCTVSVADSDGATATDTITQTVNNRAPTLSNTTITPSSGITTDTLLLCETTVADDDGETLTPTYTWTIGSNSYTGDSLQLDSTIVNPGDTITCTADVVDGYNGSATDSVSVSADNTNPVISDVSITYSGDLTSVTLLTCEYTATDADNQALTPTYTWTNLSTNTPFLSTADTLQLSPTDASPNDVVECSVTVTDTSGGTDTLPATDTVLNTDPTFSSNSVITATGTQVGDTWTCSATGTDQDDGTLTPTYEWTDVNGTPLGSGDTLVLSSTNSTPTEDITCIALITDSLGVTAASSASETVTNTTPVFDVSASITPNTGVTTSSSLQCGGTASDSDGDTPTLTYVWTNSSGTTYGSTSDTLQLTASTVLPSDVVSCTITATDDQGDTVSSSASVAVDNTLPSITASITANGTTNTGELTCSATASDDDDSTTPTITYEWFNAAGSLGTSNPLTLDSSMGVDGDTIDCTATATDLSGGTSSDTATHTITNTPPVIDSVALSPSTIDVSTSSVTCVVSSSDADGDPVTESFAWYVDGNLQSETTNMYSGPFIVGTLLACRTTPNDGKTDGDFAEDTATIQNTLPAVDTVTLSPSTVYTNDTITATAVLSDDDSSQSGSLTANYEWFVDNVSVQNGSSNTLDGVSMFNRDQSVYVTVTPNDGVEDGSPLNSGIIIVSNTPPTAPVVSVSQGFGTDYMEIGHQHGCYLAGGTLGCWGDSSSGKTTAPSGTYIALSVGNDHSCALDTSGAIVCWGLDQEGAVSGAPTSGTYTDIAAGRFHSCAIESSGGVVCWGVSDNSSSSGGMGQVDDTPTGGSYTDVSAGMFNTCAVQSDTYLDCWGDNRKDQLTDMPTDSGYVKVDVGNDHICALKNDGTIACWGINSSNTSTNCRAVDDMPTSGTFTDVSAGYHNSCAIQTDGTAVCWGHDHDGESSPPSDSFIMIDTGDTHGCGVTDAGTILCWGDNSDNRSTPPVVTLGTSGDLICSIDSASTDADGDSIVYTYEWADSNGVQQTLTEVTDTSDVFLASGLTTDTWTCDVTPYDGTDYGTSASDSVAFESRCASLDFDGVDDIVDVPSYTMSGDLTFETWIKWDASVGGTLYGHECLEIKAEAGTGNFFVYLDPQCDGASSTLRTPTAIPMTDAITADTWTHFALTSDGASTATIYLNGSEQATFSLSSYTHGSGPYGGGIAHYTVNGTPNYHAELVMSSLRISNSIRYTGNFTPTTQWSTDGDTVLLYRFASGQGAVLVDSSGNEYDGNIDDALWNSMCPEADNDEDGYAAWEDCDDGDASVGTDCPCDDSGLGVYADFETGTDCPISYWDMETVDSSGNPMDLIDGNNLVPNGNPSSGVSGMMGDAWEVTGSNQYFLSTNAYPSELNGTSAKSISLWANYGTLSTMTFGGDNQPLFGFGSDGCSGKSFTLSYNHSSGYEGVSFIGCNEDIHSLVTLSTDEWNHLVVTYANSTITLFVNGTQVASDTVTIDTTQSFDYYVLGGDVWHAANSGISKFLGDAIVDEVKVFNYELSAPQVSDLYNIDADGDGYAAWEDCDDTDASVPSVNDQDCDGITVSAGDCNDNDASIYPFAGDTYGDGIDSDCDGLDCEAGSDGSTYFAVCPDETTWNTGQSNCQNAGYDGLVSIQSSSEDQLLRSMFDNSYFYWIGFNDLVSDGSWEWISGLPVTYTNWQSGQPGNNPTIEHCAMMYSSSYSNYQWNDLSCNATQNSANGNHSLGYICEQR